MVLNLTCPGAGILLELIRYEIIPQRPVSSTDVGFTVAERSLRPLCVDIKECKVYQYIF